MEDNKEEMSIPEENPKSTEELVTERISNLNIVKEIARVKILKDKLNTKAIALMSGDGEEDKKLIKSIKSELKEVNILERQLKEGYDVDKEKLKESMLRVEEIVTDRYKDEENLNQDIDKDTDDFLSSLKKEGKLGNMPSEQPRGCTFKQLLDAKTTADRKKLLNGLSNEQRLELLLSAQNTPKWRTEDIDNISRFIPNTLSKLAGKIRVEVPAEENKMFLKKATQEHLIMAKAQSDLVLKDLMYDLKGVEVDDSEMYGLKRNLPLRPDVKFKHLETIDGDQTNTSLVDPKKVIVRGAKYLQKKTWRFLSNSPMTTSIIRVEEPKPGKENIDSKDLKDEDKNCKVYSYDYYAGKYDLDAALTAVNKDPYQNLYDELDDKRKKLAVAGEEDKLSYKEKRFLDMYVKYRGNLEAAKTMQEVSEIYSERHPAKSVKDIRIDERSKNFNKELVLAGIKVSNGKDKNKEYTPLQEELMKHTREKRQQAVEVKEQEQPEINSAPTKDDGEVR